MPKFVVCINSGLIRDAQMFDIQGLYDNQLDELDYFDCELEHRWQDREVSPFVGVTESDDGEIACAIVGEKMGIDPRALFAIQV